MRRTFRTALLSIALGAGSTPALADGFAVGAGFGTLGWELQAATEINSFLVLRLNGNVGSFTLPGFYGSSFGGFDYDIEGDLRSVGLVADFHPLGLSPVGSGFVVSGGVYYNRNEFMFKSGTIDASTVGLGGSPSGSTQLIADVDFDADYAPYLAIGYDGTFQGVVPVSFYGRVGVLFQGSPNVTIRDTAGLVQPGDLASEEQQLEDDLSTFEYYPAISIGLTVSF